MADEIDVTTAKSVETTETAPAVKKTRKPRRPRASAEATVGEVVAAEAPAKKTRAKRTQKAAVVNAPKGVRKYAAKSVSTAEANSVATAVAAIDDIADLIKLEEENKSLRMQLSDKLRAENAELRKKLGQ